MQLTPEIKKQLEEQKKQCVYCKIISKEIPGKVVFEDEKTQAILDIYPVRKGHVVFILKEHYPLLPYVPGEEFKQLFGLIPQLSKAIKSGMVSTALNLFIANGWAAGQQFPHVLVHLFPRDSDDQFFNYFFEKRKFSLSEKKIEIFKQNFPIMMQNHFGRHPADWHQGKGKVPAFLTEVNQNNTVIYEDEKVLCIVPKKGMSEGHLEIYSKLEESHIENLSISDSSHLFFVASLAANLVFEGLQLGQNGGTNIVLKSGRTDDNPSGRLCIHILPRKQDDHLKDLIWTPKPPKYDLDSIKNKISDKTWKIKYVKEAPPKLIYSNSQEEIRAAIETVLQH